MKLLLTGANGFVGSHILDRLVRSGRDVTILLRKTSDTRFIRGHLPHVRVVYGSLHAQESLRQALEGVDVVIHCAGKTKAVRKQEYHAVNVEGTQNVVNACNAFSRSIRQLVFISSLAASGPGTVGLPASEDAPPRPVSEYGKSKLLAEKCIRRTSRVPYTILRPAAVYGPRDRDFYLAFRMARWGFAPLINGGSQDLSLIYVADVAAGVLKSVGREQSLGNTYHLAHPVPLAQKEFLLRIAEVMGVKAVQFFVPAFGLYPVCLLNHLAAALTGKPGILNLDKIAEYAARGWVCTTQRAAEGLDFVAGTSLQEGLRRALDWYEKEGWLPGR